MSVYFDVLWLLAPQAEITLLHNSDMPKTPYPAEG